jgi:bifunctional N-acetylglucosamine-1-phosphate-uridyltransferase/glucosamine-1-phosphate-acetyltransferase GlmU-like protein
MGLLASLVEFSIIVLAAAKGSSLRSKGIKILQKIAEEFG